ncbi:hypothetical protein GCM10007893_07610 [Paracoccus marinus]|nr:hypothetical protein GCM10007893_07610 [Paracoccus marinus]
MSARADGDCAPAASGSAPSAIRHSAAARKLRRRGCGIATCIAAGIVTGIVTGIMTSGRRFLLARLLVGKNGGAGKGRAACVRSTILESMPGQRALAAA